MTQLPFVNDLKSHTQVFQQEILNKLSEIVSRGWFILGAEVSNFEKAFAAYNGTQFCVSVANGTDALELAIKALELPNRANIATVANAGMYATTAILQCSLEPVFIDIEKQSMTMSSEDLEEKYKKHKFEAIIVTHLYGQAANILAIMEFAKKNGIKVIEDCAQAHGAVVSGKKVGSFADLSTFSFYPTKNLGAAGDGGAVVTNDLQLYEKSKKLRQYGWAQKYHVELLGARNSRLDEMQAAILNIKLPALDKMNERRRLIVQSVKNKCKGLKSIQFPEILDESYVAHLFVVQTAYVDKLTTFLKQKKIAVDVHYPVPDHRQKAFQERYARISLPVTEESCRSILTLPCYPEMTDEQMNYLADCLNEFEQCIL